MAKKSKETNPFIGRWRINSMSAWDEDYSKRAAFVTTHPKQLPPRPNCHALRSHHKQGAEANGTS